MHGGMDIAVVKIHSKRQLNIFCII